MRKAHSGREHDAELLAVAGREPRSRQPNTHRLAVPDVPALKPIVIELPPERRKHVQGLRRSWSSRARNVVDEQRLWLSIAPDDFFTALNILRHIRERTGKELTEASRRDAVVGDAPVLRVAELVAGIVRADLGLVLRTPYVEPEGRRPIRHRRMGRAHARRIVRDEIQVLSPLSDDIEPARALGMVDDRPSEASEGIPERAAGGDLGHVWDE